MTTPSPTPTTDATEALWGDGGLFDQISRLVTDAKAQALREAADAYDPKTEHQARGWVKGWLLDRADEIGGRP